jgi:PIN domain nuclease of toxin-antitoxin system
MWLLLDAHAYVWFRAGSPQLSAKAKAAMLDPANQLFLSRAAAWEIVIKQSIGKLTLTQPLAILFNPLPQGIQWLDISVDHLLTLAALPFHHRDPFDRLLVAQCLAEKMTLVSADVILDTNLSHGPRTRWHEWRREDQLRPRRDAVRL